MVLEHRDDAAERVLPDLALGLHVAAEATEFGDRRRFAGAHFDAAVRYKIECGNAFGDALRWVGGQLHDAVAEPDVLRPLAGGAEKDFRRRRVRIFLEKVVLDLPGVVVAKPVGQLHLIERILIELPLIIRSPRTRKLQFVEDAEFHGLFPDLLASIPPEPDQGVKGSACTREMSATHKDRHFHIRMTNFSHQNIMVCNRTWMADRHTSDRSRKTGRSGSVPLWQEQSAAAFPAPSIWRILLRTTRWSSPGKVR